MSKVVLFIVWMIFCLPISVYAVITGDIPEARTTWQEKAVVWGRQHMIVAANPLATAAGREMLRAGGSATDAAIAAQLVLGLVEPQSSGLGGGSMMLVFDELTQKVHAYDGREVAPYSAHGNLFLHDGKPIDFDQAVVGGLSVGVPGLVRVLSLAHQRHGKLSWKRLFQPAIRLAERGFIISPRMATLLAQEPRLRNDPMARAYFYDKNGNPKIAGMRLRNPDLAKTLHMLAHYGADIFYQGKIAKNIVETIQKHPTNPGRMNLEDLQNYKAREYEAICSPFRRWLVCGMPPPSSGGIAIAQILGMFAIQPPLLAQKTVPEPQNININDTGTIQWTVDQAHYFSEAGKLAFADRDQYVADDHFVSLPGGSWKSLLNPNYLAKRAASIGPNSKGIVQPGVPDGADLELSNQISDEAISTTHLSVVDINGQAVSMTSSIETAFGAHIMTNGFLLNNQLTDFSFFPERDGKLIANRVQANKRPRSSMAPSIVLEDGRLKMIVGAPGGPNIINYVAKVILAALDWDYSLSQAVSLPNIGSRNNGIVEVESGLTSTELISGLEKRGHHVKTRDMTSGIHAIMRIDLADPIQHFSSYQKDNIPFIWQGSADPRREGIALSD